MTTPITSDEVTQINNIFDAHGIRQLHLDPIKDEAHLEKATKKLRGRARNIQSRMKMDTDHKMRAQRQVKVNAIYEALELLEA